PDADVGVWVCIGAYGPEHARVVLFGLRDAIEQRAMLKRDNLDAHPELFQIILNQRGHLCPLGAGRTGDEGKLHGLSAGIQKPRVAIRSRAPGKTRLLQKLARFFERARRMWPFLVSPAPVSGCDSTPQRCATSLVNAPDHRLAVYG